METVFLVLSLKMWKGSRSEIWSLWGMITVLLILPDLHPDKILVFPRGQESLKWIGAKMMEIVVVEINMPLRVS